MAILFSESKSIILFAFLYSAVRSLKPEEQHDIPLFKNEAELEKYYRNMNPNDVSGKSSFDQVVRAKTFIDKSELIKAWFDFGKKFIYLTAPPKYGKTTNLDMFYRYLDAETLSNGSVIQPASSTKNFHLFKNTKLFKSQSYFFYSQYQKYKVIHMDFSSLISVKDLSSLRDNLCTVICPMMIQHRSLKENGSKYKWFNHTDNVAHCMKYCVALSLGELQTAGKELSRELHKAYDKKIIVLCDEYDSILRAIILRAGMNQATTNRMLTNLGRFISITVENNEFVDGCICFGVLTIAGLFPRLVNNVEHYYAIEEPEFSEYFGYTQNDVDCLLQRYNKFDDRENVKLWYGGSTIKTSRTRELYSPISVNSFLLHGKLKRFWVGAVAQEDLVDRFLSHPTFGADVQRILSGNSRQYVFSKQKPNWKTISAIKSCGVGKKPAPMSAESLEVLVQLMTENGYFTKQQGMFGETYVLEPLNYEIKAYLKEALFDSDFILNLLKLKESDVERLAFAVNNLAAKKDTVQALAKAVHLHFKNVCPIKDDQVDFHGVMYGSLITKKVKEVGLKLVHTDAKINQPPKKAPRSKSDIEVLTDEDNAIIMQVTVKNDSIQALKQMYYQKHYPEVLEKTFSEYKIKHTICLGINLDETCECEVSISYMFDSQSLGDLSKEKTVYYPKRIVETGYG